MDETIKSPTQSVPETLPSMHVLVVEDDEGLNKLAQRALLGAGFDVLGVLTGAEAIERVMVSPDLVLLLDQQLPDMTGTELIRTLAERGYNVPFVAMTGRGDENVAVEMMKLGASDYLVKGFDLSETLPKIFDRLFKELETKRRLVRAEDALRLSEEQYRFAMEASNDGIWDFNLATNEFSYSDRWGEMLGYAQGDVKDMGCFCDKNTHPDDLERFQETFADYLEGRTDSYDIEFRLRAKGGDYKWIRSRGRIVERDHKGKPVRVVGAHTDISKRKQAEQAQMASEQRLRSLFENMDSGVAVYEARDNGNDFVFMDFNPKAEQISNRKREDVLGRSLRDLFPNIDSSELVIALRRVWESGVNEHLEPFYYQDDISKGWRENHIYRLPTGEVVAIYDDVTKRMQRREELIKAKEVAEAANQAKSEFLANMSHEIRTPLNGIMGMIQLLQSTELDDEQKEYVLDAILSTKRLTRLLSDILDISRVEAGKMVVRAEPFDLSKTIRRVIDLFQLTSKQSGVKLLYHLDPTIPHQIVGDTACLEQVLNNLVGNALKFTEAGSVNVDIHPLPVQHSNECKILFSVSDTGIGIADDKFEMLFDSFTQVSEGYTKQYQGAGLGLAICKRLIDLVGGNMSVDSKLGEGTTFHFSITFGRPDVSPPKPKVIKQKIEPLVKPYKILSAEDDRVSSIALQRQLEKLGHKVTSVSNGHQAVEALRQESFDVVLMDVQMPVMGGVEATQAIRSGEAGEHNKQIPIIALTAFAMIGDKEKFLEVGMNDYAAKPVDIETLRIILGKVLH